MIAHALVAMPVTGTGSFGADTYTARMSKPNTDRPASSTPKSLTGLGPFLRPYRVQIALAALFLVGAAMATLAFPLALRSLIDSGLVAADPGDRVMALREHFLALFGVGAALGVFSALRFYMVSWLGERVTADLRNAVYAHVVQAKPRVLRDQRHRRGAVAG